MPGAKPFHVAFTSPLPLLGLTEPSASLLIHRVDLAALPASPVAGTATLTLSRDRRMLTLGLDAAGRFATAVPNLYLVLPERSSEDAQDSIEGAAIVLEFGQAEGGQAGGGRTQVSLEARFDLADPAVERGPAAPAFAAAARLYARRDSFLIDGMTVTAASPPEGAAQLCLAKSCTARFSSPPGAGERPSATQAPGNRAYLRRRIADETEAALRAHSAAAAAIHVRLATLYVRNLAGAGGADRTARAFG